MRLSVLPRRVECERKLDDDRNRLGLSPGTSARIITHREHYPQTRLRSLTLLSESTIVRRDNTAAYLDEVHGDIRRKRLMS